jgi:acyl-CoA thioesterase I
MTVKPRIQLEAGNRIVFIGDSITDADRDECTYGPLGRGYVHFVGNALLAKYPDLNLDIVNTGVGGDTVSDMQRRWETDCLSRQPNVLSVMIGVNDAWYRAIGSDIEGRVASPEQYEVTYDQLLVAVKKRCDCQVVLMEPFVFSADLNDRLRGAVEPYVEIAGKLAAKYRTVLVPLQKNINELIVRVAPERWSDDSVHPLPWAHAWIAQQWLEATGL